MPTLIKSERQTLRAIQDHILAQRRLAGAAYTQLSTVGVMYHPDNSDPTMNMITPHQGVAWTRGDDIREGFSILESRGRVPRLQFLRGLFPDAFSRQIELNGLQLEDERPIWLYSPILGPVPQGEVPFGRLPESIHVSNFSIEAVVLDRIPIWHRTYQSALYGIDMPLTSPNEVELLQEDYQSGDSHFILGRYHDNPVAAMHISQGATASELLGPAVLDSWSGMGFEDGLIKYGVEAQLQNGYQVVYTIGSLGFDSNLYWRLGFIHLTQLLIYTNSDNHS
jgi:hypothetical protein